MAIVQQLRRIALLGIAGIVVFSTSGMAQSVSKNAVYAEILGAGVLYSVNYERFISDDFTVRIGISSFSIRYNDGKGHSNFLIVPLVANYQVGHGNSKLEIGAGIDYVSDNAFSLGDITRTQVESKQSSAGVIIIGSLGYRYQPSDGGMHFRIFVTPFLSPYSSGYSAIWFGSSIGVCF